MDFITKWALFQPVHSKERERRGAGGRGVQRKRSKENSFPSMQACPYENRCTEMKMDQ